MRRVVTPTVHYVRQTHREGFGSDCRLSASKPISGRFFAVAEHRGREKPGGVGAVPFGEGAGIDWLGEADSENEAYHALLFRVLGVGERHGATTEAEADVAVAVGMSRYECRGSDRPASGGGA